MSHSSPFLVWQIADSAFPTGAFAHSWGLEAAWQYGEISRVEDLHAFVAAAARQTAFGVVLLLNAAFVRPNDWRRLDGLADAFLTNAIANRASRQQGRTLLATATRVWPSAAFDTAKATAGQLAAHLGPVSGIVFRQIGLTKVEAQQVMLYGTVRGVVSAAVRLGIIGSYEGQRMQRDSITWLDALVPRCADLDEPDLAQVSPVPDLLQATHDRLYSRLFQS